MNKRRWAALALSLLLVLQLAMPPKAQAAGYVCFVAAGESVLPLSDDTMPFWNSGYLYVSSTIFTGAVRNTLGISCARSEKDQTVVLYNSSQSKYLAFKKDRYYAHDVDGNTYYPGAVSRNGQMFVPVSLVAQFFGLQYSVNQVSGTAGNAIQGDLAWLRQPGGVLSDKAFMDAAASVIANRYEAYLKEQKLQQITPEVPTVPQEPAGAVEIDGKLIYLCMTAGANTPALLDVLDRYNAQAAFFCTPEFLEQQGDLLRRMTATGQSIGILADAGDQERTVEEQLEAGNRALERATCGRTRLVRLKNGDKKAVEQLNGAGYRCLEPDLDRSTYYLRSLSNADSLLQRVLARKGDSVAVWLADRADALGLRYFLADVRNNDSRCLAWTETT